MRNPYDNAHELAKSLKESSEYVGFKEASNRLKELPEMKKHIQDFFKKQMELEFKMMSGEQPPEDEIKKLEDLYRLIQLHPAGVEFLEKQMKFQRLMADIMKIINESVAEGTQILTEKDGAI